VANFSIVPGTLVGSEHCQTLKQGRFALLALLVIVLATLGINLMQSVKDRDLQRSIVR